MSTGQVRVRSNVAGSKRWDLVPGELLRGLPRVPFSRLTRRQHDEQMYYVPCSICHRTIASINLEGCTLPGCKAPAPAAAEHASAEWQAQVDAALRREASESAATGESEIDQSTDSS